MAATKKPRTPTPTSPPNISSAAIKHGHEAAGAKMIKKGFAASPERDLHFALGFPHMRFLIDDPQSDADAAAEAAAALEREWEVEVTWPRKVAERLARYCLVKKRWGLDGKPHVAAALNDRRPIREEEARAMIAEELNYPEAHDDRSLILLLEALVGPDVVLDAAVSNLEKLPESVWFSMENHLSEFASTLGFTLLRVPEDAARAFRTRLSVLEKQWRDADPDGDGGLPIVQGLDLALHGRAGAERSAYRVDEVVVSSWLVHVLDDPDYVAERAAVSGATEPPDPRITFLGGASVLVGERRGIKAHRRHAELVDLFADIRLPEIVPLMLEMSATSKAKKQATAWFVANAAFAKPHLEKIHGTKKNPTAAWAQALLAKI
ncbi:MAG: hypothetical protein NVS3B20_24010 [Polyangiales bacterium]